MSLLEHSAFTDQVAIRGWTDANPITFQTNQLHPRLDAAAGMMVQWLGADTATRPSIGAQILSSCRAKCIVFLFSYRCLYFFLFISLPKCISGKKTPQKPKNKTKQEFRLLGISSFGNPFPVCKVVVPPALSLTTSLSLTSPSRKPKVLSLSASKPVCKPVAEK